MPEATQLASQPVLTFAELLAADEYEVERWHKHFQAHPDLFDRPTQIAGAGTLGGLIHHITAVQYMYACWLLDLPMPDIEEFPKDIEGCFRIAAQARDHLANFISRATPEELGKILEYREGDFYLRCTKRKAFVQTVLHGDRHWAQVAVAVREAGHATDWIHDFVFSPAME